MDLMDSMDSLTQIIESEKEKQVKKTNNPIENKLKSRKNAKKCNIKENTKTDEKPLKVTGGSPQINFALWNIFRFLLQCIGVTFLFRATADDSWWRTGLICFISLCAVPVFLQSLFLFGNKVHQLRLMWLRGTLGPGSFKHLFAKELFRMLLVGFVSTICICSMPFLMKSKYFGEISWVTATVISLFVYFFTNLAYSILAQGTTSIILMTCGKKSRRIENDILPSKKKRKED